MQVILLNGAEHHFTAGNDLQDFLEQAPLNLQSPVFQFLMQLAHFSKPLLAAVEGFAVGIGATLLLHCDLVYAEHNARFALPFVPLGLCPEAASSLLLPNRIGYANAAEKLFFGEVFSAQEAYRIGLVNQLLAEEEIQVYAKERAHKLTQLPQQALKITKRLLKQNNANIDQRLQEEGEYFSQLLQEADAQQAIQKFLNK